MKKKLAKNHQRKQLNKRDKVGPRFALRPIIRRKTEAAKVDARLRFLIFACFVTFC